MGVAASSALLSIGASRERQQSVRYGLFANAVRQRPLIARSGHRHSQIDGVLALEHPAFGGALALAHPPFLVEAGRVGGRADWRGYRTRWRSLVP